MGRTVALLLSVAVLAGCGGDQTPAATSDTPTATTEPVAATTEPPSYLAPPDDPSTHDARGLVAAVLPLGAPNSDGSCFGAGVYSDISEGTQVRIKGATDNIVAVTELNQGEWLEEQEACVWTFAVDIPVGEDFYMAEIADFGASDVLSEKQVSNREPFIIVP